MSEKHLSEVAWKAVAVKHKVKDVTLQKALVKFAGLKVEEHDARLKALKEIEECAGDLKKEHKDAKEVFAYLEEIEKEIKKSRKSVEEARKGGDKESGEEEAEDKEAEDEEKQAKALKAQLLASMGKVKSAGGAESIPFLACVAKPAYGLVLGKSASDKPGAKHRALLTKLTKGTKFMSGVCLFEEKAHTFVLDTVPGGLAQHLKNALTKSTGGSFKVRVRDTAGTVVLDGDSDVIPDEAAEQGESEGQEGEGEADLAAVWKKLRAELLPTIKKVLAANPANRAGIVKLANEASKQEKAGNFQGAIDAFEELRPLLADGAKAPPPPPPPPPDENALKYTQRLKALMPDLQRALKEQLGDTGKMRAVAAFAREKAAAEDYEAAIKALDALKKLLSEATGGGAPEKSGNEMAEFTARLAALIPKVKANPKIKWAEGTSDEKGLNVVLSEAGMFARKKEFEKAHALLDEIGALLVNAGSESETDEAEEEADETGKKSKDEARESADDEASEGAEDETEEVVPGGPASPVWQAAKEKVDAQLVGLYGILKRVGLPVLEEAASQIEQVLGNYRTKLVAALMDYDKSTGPAKDKARQKALEMVTTYQAQIPKDKHVIAADTNPFGVKLNISETLGAALVDLQKQLSQAP